MNSDGTGSIVVKSKSTTTKTSASKKKIKGKSWSGVILIKPNLRLDRPRKFFEKFTTMPKQKTLG